MALSFNVTKVVCTNHLLFSILLQILSNPFRLAEFINLSSFINDIKDNYHYYSYNL